MSRQVKKQGGCKGGAQGGPNIWLLTTHLKKEPLQCNTLAIKDGKKTKFGKNARVIDLKDTVIDFSLMQKNWSQVVLWR